MSDEVPAVPSAPEEAGEEGRRLVLIGTGHVFRIAGAVREAIVAIGPDVVFVELDHGRYQALADRRAGKPLPEPQGFVHKRLQGFQESVAGMYGAQVGEEMLAAVDGARLVQARCMLIDPPAQDTVRKVLRSMTWRERLRGVGMIVGNVFSQVLPSRRKGKDELEREIRRYQQQPDVVLAELRDRFPSLHRIVIEERDELMAGRIRLAMQTHRLGVAVVGDGHVPGMQRLLSQVPGITLEVHRLDDVRSGRLPRPETFSFGFDATYYGP